jgi:hypothetical protein
MPSIKINKLNGGLIQGADWPVETLGNLREGHPVQVSIDINEDSLLIPYLTKRKDINCVLERIDGKYSIIVTCVIKAFRHMLDREGLDSMAIAVPLDRTIEGALIYTLDTDKSDPKFINLLKQHAG